MYKTILVTFLFSLSANAFIMVGSQVNAVDIAPGAVILGADTSGRYVGNLTASGGVSTSGAGDGEDISHALSVDQSFEPTWTGIQTFTPSGTKDVIINTDADSLLTLNGLQTTNGDGLCLTAGSALAVCNDASFAGNITASNLSGTNTGDQTITLTGDVTGTGTGSFAATISANSVALTTDTTGDYVGTLAAGTGISTTGAASGEGIAHSVSVDQTFSPTWTGSHTHVRTGAGASNTFIIDQNGDPSARETTTIYTTTGMAEGDLAAVKFVLIDTADATGGQMSGLNVQKTGTGTNSISAVVAGVGIYPIVTLTGTLPAGPEQAWIETVGPVYVDATTNFGTTATDSTLFVADNDCIYVGNATTYYQIEVDLATLASANIAATFAYSTAVGFTQFFPNDGTAGFTRNGNINFDKAELLTAGWASRSVNAVSKYYIRICRTENTLATPPIEDSIFLTDGTVNQWDNEGLITIQQIQTNGAGTNDIAGRIQMTGTFASHTTCDASAVGTFEMFDNGANKISLCVCEKTGAVSYAWGAVTSGGSC